MKALIESHNPSGFRMVADSAFGRNGQPWFVPDFGQNWEWSVMLAFRVSRLGKSISPKFANRYIDAVTLLFVPRCDSPEADVLLSCMDGGAVSGVWRELNEEYYVNGERVDVAMSHVFDFVALTSRYVTLKTGDILAVEISDFKRRAACVNDRVEFSLNGEKTLWLNIK